MRTVITYYVDGESYPYYDKEQAEKAQIAANERNQRWEENFKHPDIVLEKLVLDLKNSMFIPEGTIATCTMRSLIIKGMVRVCQEFVEKNKEYLNYY